VSQQVSVRERKANNYTSILGLDRQRRTGVSSPVVPI